jgi:hypothetical protein
VKGLLIAAVLFPIAGCIVGRRPLSEIFLFGVGIVGAAMFVLGVLHVPFAIGIAIVLVAGPLTRRFAPPSPGGRGAEGWAALLPLGEGGRRPDEGRVAMVIAIIPLLLIAIPAAIIPLNDFDGRAFWLLKAKALANERTINGPFFHNEVVDDPRNQYPLLLPLDAATIMMIAGEDDDRQVRALYFFTFAAFVFYVARRINPWCAAVLAWTPQFLVSNEGGVLTAYSDIAIAAFVACAFFELLDGKSPLRFGAWLAFLILTKNEGLPIAIVLGLIGIASFHREIVRAIGPPAIAAIALFAWRSGIPKTDEEDYFRLLPTLPSRLNRLGPAIVESSKHFFAVSSWGFVWIAVWIAIAILIWRKEWRAPAVVISICAVYLGAYITTNWIMRELVDASADRLLMHAIGPALFAISRAIDVIAQNRYGPPEYQSRPA